MPVRRILEGKRAAREQHGTGYMLHASVTDRFAPRNLMEQIALQGLLPLLPEETQARIVGVEYWAHRMDPRRYNHCWAATSDSVWEGYHTRCDTCSQVSFRLRRLSWVEEFRHCAETHSIRAWSMLTMGAALEVRHWFSTIHYHNQDPHWPRKLGCLSHQQIMLHASTGRWHMLSCLGSWRLGCLQNSVKNVQRSDSSVARLILRFGQMRPAWTANVTRHHA